jgi:septum formation protein
MTAEACRLVLASGSATRRMLLQSSGIAFDVRPADVDEDAIRNRMLAEDAAVSHESIAQRLADEKARAVSAQDPDALVIGSDQVLSFEGEIFAKPASVEDARTCLLRLRGKSHALHSATALARGGQVEWRDVRSARLALRAFSEAALDSYLARAGEAILTSVGAYQIEGPAIQLFDSVDGDHATILGLPLLPLLAELRSRGVVQP